LDGQRCREHEQAIGIDLAPPILPTRKEDRTPGQKSEEEEEEKEKKEVATWHGSGLNEEESWRNGRGTEPMLFVPLLARSVPDREGIRISRLPIDVVALVPLLSHAARQGRRRRRADAGDLAVAGRIFLLSLSIYRLHGIDPRRPRTKGTVAARLPAVGLF